MLEENTINQTRNKKSTSGPHLPGPYMFTYITGTITSTIIGITHRFRSIFMQNEQKNEQKKQKQDKDQQQIGFQSGVWLVYLIAAALAAVTETRLPTVAVFLPLVSSLLVLLTAILYQLA
jgi:hypothetical protein